MSTFRLFIVSLNHPLLYYCFVKCTLTGIFRTGAPCSRSPSCGARTTSPVSHTLQKHYSVQYVVHLCIHDSYRSDHAELFCFFHNTSFLLNCFTWGSRKEDDAGGKPIARLPRPSLCMTRSLTKLLGWTRVRCERFSVALHGHHSTSRWNGISCESSLAPLPDRGAFLPTCRPN